MYFQRSAELREMLSAGLHGIKDAEKSCHISFVKAKIDVMSRNRFRKYEQLHQTLAMA